MNERKKHHEPSLASVPFLGKPIPELEPRTMARAVIAREFPRGQYTAITANPPWRFWERAGKKDAQQNSIVAARDYTPLPLKDIRALPVARIAAPNSVLFLWTPNTILPEGLSVMRAWGFQFQGIAFTWMKTPSAAKPKWGLYWHMGLTYWARANSETCLFSVKGKLQLKPGANNVRQLIMSQVRENSRKPDEFYNAVTRMVCGPYINLFARQHRKGWEVWNNQSINKSNEKNEGRRI